MGSKSSPRHTGTWWWVMGCRDETANMEAGETGHKLENLVVTRTGKW